MLYAIMRCKKLASAGSVASALKHCYRERETLNADSDRTPQNEHGKASSTSEAMGLLRSMLPTKRRKDAVLAVEYLMTASPEWWKKASREQQADFFKQSKDWLAQKFGQDRIIVATIHRDETSPHLSAFVVPLTKDGRLSAKEFVGNRTQLSADQTSYAKAVRHLGLERGIEGSKARHTTISEYYTRISVAAPKAPLLDVPEPSMTDRLKPALYGQKVADSIVAQLSPTWSAYQAKSLDFDRTRMKVAELQAAATMAGKTAHAEKARADRNQALVELFSPAEIAAARLRKEAEANERERRIDALPGLRLRTSGAGKVFVEFALRALVREDLQADKVDWPKVEGNAAREAISKAGHSPASVISAICELSPIRGNPASHAKLTEWVMQKAPEFQKEHLQQRDRGGGLER